MSRTNLLLGSSCLLATVLAAGCPAPPAEPAPPQVQPGPQPAPPDCVGCKDPDPPSPMEPAADMSTPPAAKPRIGVISLRHTRMNVSSLTVTNWDTDVELRGNAAAAPTPVGDCLLYRYPAAAAKTLNAGELTISGTVNGPVRLLLDAEADAYLPVESEDDASDGRLFTENSELQLSAKGGADLKALLQSGTWRGVKPLEWKGPETLDMLPAASVALFWAPAPKEGTTMEVSFRSREQRIDCAVPEDRGTYTVKQEVLRAVPTGPVYLFVSRVARAEAQTSPDRGLVQLESRSSWQIVTRK